MAPTTLTLINPSIITCFQGNSPKKWCGGKKTPLSHYQHLAWILTHYWGLMSDSLSWQEQTHLGGLGKFPAIWVVSSWVNFYPRCKSSWITHGKKSLGRLLLICVHYNYQHTWLGVILLSTESGHLLQWMYTTSPTTQKLWRSVQQSNWV